MADKTVPNRASNMEKAEGDRWTSKDNQVPSGSRDEGDSGMRGKDEGGGRRKVNEGEWPERNDREDDKDVER
jgi:hypothetical protein